MPKPVAVAISTFALLQTIRQHSASRMLLGLPTSLRFPSSYIHCWQLQTRLATHAGPQIMTTLTAFTPCRETGSYASPNNNGFSHKRRQYGAMRAGILTALRQIESCFLFFTFAPISRMTPHITPVAHCHYYVADDYSRAGFMKYYSVIGIWQ